MEDPREGGPSRERTGAISTTRRRRRLPWWLLVLLALLIIGALLFVLLRPRDSDKNQPAVTSSSKSQSAQPAASGRVVSGDTNLLALPASSLSQYDAKPVAGHTVVVQSLAGVPAAGQSGLDDERFFVGDANRGMLVFLHVNAELPFEVQAGRTISFSGVLKKADSSVNALDLTPEAAQQLSQQGYYVEVTDLNSVDQR